MSAVNVCLHGGPKDGEVTAVPADLLGRGLQGVGRDPVAFNPLDPLCRDVRFSQVHYEAITVAYRPRQQFALCPVHPQHVVMVTRS